MKMHKIIFATVASISVIALASGCSQKYSAERDGKNLGQAVCDLRNADSAEAADSAKQEIDEQLADLGSKYTFFTAEDRADVKENLADLHTHAVAGNVTLMQQDLAVLQRSVKHIADSSNEVTRAAREGVLEGLAECTE
jgi:hypothetical protein